MVTNLSVYSEAANTFLGAQVFCAITPNGPLIKQVTVPLMRNGAVFALSERFFCKF